MTLLRSSSPPGKDGILTPSARSLPTMRSMSGRNPASGSSVAATSWACTRKCQGHRGSAGDALWAAPRPGSPKGIVDYGEGPVNIVGIVELADGKVNTARFYFADPFDPPAGRARWSDAPID